MSAESIREKILAGVSATWSIRAFVELGRQLDLFRPDIVHVHNTQPMISPAAHWVASQRGIPTIQSVHNYRSFCINGLALRQGKTCVECLGRSPLDGVLHRCFRGSALASGAAAASLVAHRALGTWSRKVTLFSVPSRFTLKLLVGAGISASQLVYRPQVLEDAPAPGDHDGGYLLFVGRLAVEKGVDLLLGEEFLGKLRLPLHVCGDGPMRQAVEACARRTSKLQYYGALGRSEILGKMRKATLLLVPSLFIEVAPIALVEALAVGLPIVVSDHGALAEQADAGAGWKAPVADGNTWGMAIDSALSDPVELRRRGAAARGMFESMHAPEVGVAKLTKLYERAIGMRSSAGLGGASQSTGNV